MGMVEIKAKASDEGQEYTVLYDFGDDLAGAQAKFGSDVVYDNYVRSAKITIQAAMRRLAKAGKTETEIAAFVDQMKIGVAAERIIDPIGAATKKFATMSAEDQAKLLETLRAMAAKG
jgi:hypothetical protein